MMRPRGSTKTRPSCGWEQAIQLDGPADLTVYLEKVASTYPLFTDLDAVARICAETGVTKPAAYRILKTLETGGYVGLGVQAVELGLAGEHDLGRVGAEEPGRVAQLHCLQHVAVGVQRGSLRSPARCQLLNIADRQHDRRDLARVRHAAGSAVAEPQRDRAPLLWDATGECEHRVQAHG